MSTPPIYIISGGMGTSGEQVVRTALAQFAGNAVQVIVVPHVYHAGQLEAVVARAAETGGIIVHTLVDADLRRTLQDVTRTHGVTAIDLIGPLLMQLTRLLGQEPLGQPGLYRRLHEDYFTRIEAIEFTVEHDDGRRPHELSQAEIVLTGVSRVGKTPLSMYLSTRGWKVANIPLIREITPPQELFEVDRRRVVGLDIEAQQLLIYRQIRQKSLGVTGTYTDLAAIYEELEWARQLVQRSGFAVVDITDKPIEESADEVLAQVKRRLHG
jgi:regulator of PEP synthase PpsR (kinase-PPPase family)